MDIINICYVDYVNKHRTYQLQNNDENASLFTYHIDHVDYLYVYGASI